MDTRLNVVDVNAWLGPWPFQYFHDDTAARLEARLRAEGIAHAMVGSPEAAFNPDLLAVNKLHLQRVAGSRMLHPVTALDPTKGDWRDNLSLGLDAGVAAVRLFPGYHVYELSDARALGAVEAVARAGSLALFVQMRMEDERTHHPLCRIPGVKTASIVEMARRFPSLSVVAVCPYYHEAEELGKGPANLFFEISHVERLRTVAALTRDVPRERVLFGTHVPFLQSYASIMKLDAPYVPAETRAAIGSGNAVRIVGTALRSAPGKAATKAAKKAAPKAARKPPKKTARASARGHRG
jgi:predicted TIM-barrel fold metal-dependent hydrolase